MLVKMLLAYKADIEAQKTVKVVNQVMGLCTPMWAAAATGCLDVAKLSTNASTKTESENNRPMARGTVTKLRPAER